MSAAHNVIVLPVTPPPLSNADALHDFSETAPLEVMVPELKTQPHLDCTVTLPVEALPIVAVLLMATLPETHPTPFVPVACSVMVFAPPPAPR